MTYTLVVRQARPADVLVHNDEAPEHDDITVVTVDGAKGPEIPDGVLREAQRMAAAATLPLFGSGDREALQWCRDRLEAGGEALRGEARKVAAGVQTAEQAVRHVATAVADVCDAIDGALCVLLGTRKPEGFTPGQLAEQMDTLPLPGKTDGQ